MWSFLTLGLEDGATVIMVLENPGPIVLHTRTLRDRGRALHVAAVSPPLQHPVARLVVSAGAFKDLREKSQLFVSLVRGDEVLLRHGLWGARGSEEVAPETLSIEDELVSKAEPGMVLRMEYQVGGSLEVLNWICALL